MTLIGVGWGLSPHASSFKLKFSISKTANSTEFLSKILLETPGNRICLSVRHPGVAFDAFDGTECKIYGRLCGRLSQFWPHYLLTLTIWSNVMIGTRVPGGWADTFGTVKTWEGG